MIDTKEQLILKKELHLLQSWWQRYGRYIAIAVGLALVLFVGWAQWSYRMENQLIQASNIYQDMIDLMQSGSEPGDEKSQEIIELAKTLRQDHGDTSYAYFGALIWARLAVDEGDLDRADILLRWVLNHEKLDPLFRPLIVLRQVKLLYSRGEHDLALKLLDQNAAAYLIGPWHIMRADLFYEAGKLQEAVKYYELARELYDEVYEEQIPEFLTMRLDQLQSDQATVQNVTRLREATEGAEQQPSVPAAPQLELQPPQITPSEP